MLAEFPVISPAFQFLLNGIGWLLATIYRFIPNYGASIVVLTIIIRFVLLPLGIKQIKSMQHMQALAPKIKELQKKYKGNKQKAQEEQMKLYKEAGVSPLGGCLPLLLQFPILIAMYAVLRTPTLEPVPIDAPANTAERYVVHDNHLPVDSRLFRDVITHQHTGIGAMNLQCSPAQAGSTAQLADSKGNPILEGRPLIDGGTVASADPATLPSLPAELTSNASLDCGGGPAAKIPYFLLLAGMIATTFYQQRQMQKASPPGAASQQQQAIMKFLPLMFGIFGYGFPGSLILYWTVANLFQISQQALLLRAGHIGPDALERRIAEQRQKTAARGDAPVKKGFIARLMEQAAEQQTTRRRSPPTPPKGASKGSKGGTQRTQPRPQGPRRKPNTGGSKPKGAGGGPKKRPGGGGGGGSGG